MKTRYKKLHDFTSLLTFCIKIKNFVVRYAGNSGQGIMLNTASHELVHFIRQWSPEKYKILADFLMEQYGEKDVSVDKLVNMQIEKAKALGRKISYEEAHEEVIADSMETMLNDGKVIEKLQMLQAKDKTLFEKIRDYLTDLINRIKKAYKDVRPETPEGEIIAGIPILKTGIIERLQQFCMRKKLVKNHIMLFKLYQKQKRTLYIVTAFFGKKDIKKKPHSSSMQKASM